MSKSAYEAIPLERFQEVFKDTSTEVSSVALGGKVVSFSDEFFAEASNLLKVEPSVSMKGQFGPKGALYDGWETRRHNAPNHDWVIIRLGPSNTILTGFDIDTANFTGNEGPAADVWGLKLEGDEKEVEKQEKSLKGDDARWELLLPVVPLGPSSRHLFKIEPTKKTYSHVKLSMIPDGGFGRFRAYGLPQPPTTSERIDLAYALNGGRVVSQSDQHFGIASNLLLPGRGFDMGDGWECRRSRVEGNNEWAVIRLGDGGYIDNVEIDTAYHMGNFPVFAELHAISCAENVPPLDSSDWVSILPKVKQGPHRQHFYPVENARGKVFTHVKLTIWPDGGLKRVRINGYRASSFSSGSLPHTHELKPIPQLEALPLTYEAFLPFGQVAQAYSTPTAAPRGVVKTTANQGTAAKYHKMAVLEDDYAVDGSENHRSLISVMTTQPKMQSGNSWDVTAFERHPRTSQTFVPFGKVDGQGSAYHGGSYVSTVVLSDAQGQPDLSTMRAFIVLPNQSITYGKDVWHQSTLVADSPITFATIESIPPHLPEADIAFFKTGGIIAQITVPKLPSTPRSMHSALSSIVKPNALSSFKSMVTSLAGSGIPCHKLTSENFKNYGHVVQAYSTAAEAPKGIATFEAPDGKTLKFHEVASVTNTYPATAAASTGISVFRCTEKSGMQQGKPWPIHFMERHPHTDQAFIPMGVSSWAGKTEDALPTGAAYVIIVADDDSNGRPDPTTTKAFFCTADQGVSYKRGVWHHPMLTVGGPIDFVCVEAQTTRLDDPKNCELLEFETPFGTVDIPDFLN